jgi:tRNA-specific 2-thiouridylase
VEKIVLALSGGVDSAVAVHLLQKQGYEVYGYTFLTGDDKAKRQDIAKDAAAVADYFDISHEIEDITTEFNDTVVTYFTEKYFHGETPNPCVFCNKTMKFPKLLAYADSLGIQKVATGHYVRMEEGRIFRAKDKSKDQSYVLCLLPEEWYPRFVFPLGDYEKKEIRAIAAGLGLPVAEKAESQENCFIPNDDYKAFLQQYPDRFHSGEFMDREGHVLGRHNGLPFYTIGQRRGIGLAFGTPKYVVKLDGEKNAVIIGNEEDLFTAACKVKGVNLIGEKGSEGFPCSVKIRYLSEPVPAAVKPFGIGIYEVKFEKPLKAVTPGQYAVFYEGDMLLGGGEIC